jgi:hypothetical protein
VVVSHFVPDLHSMCSGYSVFVEQNSEKLEVRLRSESYAEFYSIPGYYILVVMNELATAIAEILWMSVLLDCTVSFHVARRQAICCLLYARIVVSLHSYKAAPHHRR